MELNAIFSSHTKKNQISWSLLQLNRYIDYIILILLNTFTHFLFIGYFKFVSDDWPQIVYSDIYIYPLQHLFLESQRPGQFILTKVVVGVLGITPFGYHIMNLITTTVLLLLVFLIFKDLLKLFFNNSRPFAFLGAVLFCLLFNKDELYSWAALFYDNIAFVLYLSSFYFFIKSEKKGYNFYLSWLCYAGAVFIYEIGILLPVVYFIYSFIYQKDLKKVLFFFIPLMAYMLIRITNWFGYGWMYIDRSQNYLSLEFVSMFFNNYFHNLIGSVGITIISPFYAVLGLGKLNEFFLEVLLIIDLIISLIIIYYFICPQIKHETIEKKNKNFLQMIFFCLTGIFVAYIPISVHGIVQPRYLLFIDLFLILLFIILVTPLIAKQKHCVILIIIISGCLLINQGLYVNWIVSGEMQDSVNNALFSQADAISTKQYFFINSSDLFRSNPNYIFKITPGYSIIVNPNSKEVYYPYLNAEGLARWSVTAMMRGAKINESSTLLIYGDEGTIFVEENANSLTYKNTVTDKQYLIDKSDCFEGNSTTLLMDFNNNMKVNWLFRQ